jgi:hypothetical protein
MRVTGAIVDIVFARYYHRQQRHLDVAVIGRR